MQGNENFRLVVRRGPQPNQTYDLNKDIITIGRDITNDIVINDPEVSRHHLRLTRGAGGFTIEDLGSTNGTFVGGQRLTGAKPLSNGDMIGLGETVTLNYELVRQQGEMQGPTMQQQPQQPSPYAPPAQQQQQQQPPQQQQQPYQQPYQQPQQGEQGAPQAPGYPYTPPGQPQAQGPQQPYGPPPQAPPAGGYEYDPYIDEEPRSGMRLIIIGCVGLSLFCCCSVVVGLVIIDQFNLWDSIPIFSDIVTPILRSLFGSTVVLPPLLP